MSACVAEAKNMPVMPKIAPEVDELVVLETPDDFRAVGQFYNDFRQIGDKEVIELLK